MTHDEARTNYPFKWAKKRADGEFVVTPARANRTCPACKQDECEPAEVLTERVRYRCAHQFCGATWSVALQGPRPTPDQL